MSEIGLSEINDFAGQIVSACTGSRWWPSSLASSRSSSTEHTLVRVRGPPGGRGEAQFVHVGRGPAAAIIEEFLRVIIAGLAGGLVADDDVVDEVEREPVGLLVMAARRELARGPLGDHAAVERGEL